MYKIIYLREKPLISGPPMTTRDINFLHKKRSQGKTFKEILEMREIQDLKLTCNMTFHLDCY